MTTPADDLRARAEGFIDCQPPHGFLAVRSLVSDLLAELDRVTAERHEAEDRYARICGGMRSDWGARD